MEPLKLKRKCPICGNNEGEKIYHVSMMVPESFQVTGKYDVVCCSECGFIFADIDDTQESYNEYYTSCNVYSTVSKLKKEIYEQACNDRVVFLEQFLNKEDKILDIGCGSGDLLKGLREKGFYNLYGIDPSLKSVKSLQNEGIEGSVGNIFNKVPQELKGQFDLVCCTAVLEHIYDIKEAIEKICEYMKPEKGKIFIDVPAVEGFEKYKANLSNYFNHEHINYFSLQSLDNLLGNKNFIRISRESESYHLFRMENITPELIIRGVYQFHKENNNIVKDIQSVKSVKKYFEFVEEENDKRKKMLKQVISQRKEVIIWGTGAFTEWILQNVPEIRDIVACFIDNNIEKQGTKLCGKTIYASDYLTHRAITEGNESLVLICSMQNSKEIVEQIEKMNINQEYFIVE